MAKDCNINDVKVNIKNLCHIWQKRRAMLEGVLTVLRLERDAWSIVK